MAYGVRQTRTNTTANPWGLTGSQTTPEYDARIAEQWMRVFMETHGGLTPDQYNAQFGQNQAVAPNPMPMPEAAQLTPTVMPFMTPQDLMSQNAFDLANAQTLEDLDSQLAKMETDTSFQKGELDKSATKGNADTQDIMAARGLFQSSIKDAALYDIAAQKTIRQNLLDDTLANAKLSAGRQKQTIQSAIERQRQAMQLQGIANANALGGAPNTTGGAAAPSDMERIAPTPASYDVPRTGAGDRGAMTGQQGGWSLPPQLTSNMGKKKKSGWG